MSQQLIRTPERKRKRFPLTVSLFATSSSLSSTSFTCLPGPSDQTRRSSRANKGSGGQIAQLQNIEQMQTQTITRASPMDFATANEPLNPLAPLSDKQPPKRKIHPSKVGAGEKASVICRSSLAEAH